MQQWKGITQQKYAKPAENAIIRKNICLTQPALDLSNELAALRAGLCISFRFS